MLPMHLCPFCINPVAYAFVVTCPSPTTRRTGHPTMLVTPAELRSLGHLPDAGIHFREDAKDGFVFHRLPQPALLLRSPLYPTGALKSV